MGDAVAAGSTEGGVEEVFGVAGHAGGRGSLGADLTARLGAFVAFVVGGVEVVTSAALDAVGLRVAVDTALDHALAQVAYLAGC